MGWMVQVLRLFVIFLVVLGCAFAENEVVRYVDHEGSNDGTVSGIVNGRDVKLNWYRLLINLASPRSPHICQSYSCRAVGYRSSKDSNQ
jgi:hypothetical protein